ncbi:membrane protein insertion efficiency factor YidD [Nocardia sp. CNY236]|uniref:membrane protein insertion efficiency factor YidD n=1 Tax=Nocardia sp. CNY236 TaxID=1169152 RepID=UPI0003F61492|nr:membrane protein insertion efficiency factor YidD [Nocardia sp. CNY236]
MKSSATITALPANALIFLIELYRSYVSPLRLPVCRFTPTCSEYAVTALRTRGLIVGVFLAAVRIAKCAPWHPGGWDPVPERSRGTHRLASTDRAATDKPATDKAATDKAATDEGSQEPKSLSAGLRSEPNAWTGSPHAVIGDTNDGSA